MGGLIDVPAEEYHAHPAISKSKMQLLIEKTPRHYYAAHEAGDVELKTTSAMAFGSLFHTAILEPDLLDELYLSCDRRTPTAKKQAAEEGKMLVLAKELELCRRMADSVFAHPSAAKLVEQATLIEGSAFWADPKTGIECKARPDMVLPAMGVVVDLKSTVCASFDDFFKQARRLGYHRQAAHYLAGCNAVGVGVDTFVFIAVEKEPPYAVAVYEAQGLDEGAADIAYALRTIKECRESGRWPCYSNKIEVMDFSNE